jgi:DNA-binding CsgD family transcriptional regulator
MAISNLACLYMIQQRSDEAIEWGQRALDMGRRSDDHEVIAHALNNVGTSLLNLGDRRGLEMLLESAAISREHRFPEHLDRALYNIVGGAIGQRDLPTAERTVRELIDWTSRTELERCSLEAMLSEVMLHQGRLAEADRLATTSVGIERTAPQDRCQALAVLAQVKLRRGEAADALLEEASSLALGMGYLGVRWPVTAARAERAWLRGDLTQVVEELREVFDLAVLRRDSWAIGDLGRWLWRAGELTELPDHGALPYRLEVEGKAAAAAAEWDRLGVPYEAALCLAGSDAPADVRAAHGRLIEMGATAAAQRVGERLRLLGQPVPRGPRATTRANPSRLTAREAEIAELVADGLTNREIARRLVLSEKTVGHHVSAILGKLDLRRRTEIARALPSGEHSQT